MRRIDFIIAGAPRSGTTWLYEALNRHPRVWMVRPRQPEPKFFLVDEDYEKGMAWYYEKYFKDAPLDGCLLGEKSTNYLEGGKKVAERMCESIPHVKLIFSLRNPIDRALSNYSWSRVHGFEQLSFNEAVDMELTGDRKVEECLKYAQPYAYLKRGRYAELLQPFLAAFPKEQCLVLKFEDIKEFPKKILSQVQTFLGIERREEDADIGSIPNATITSRDPLSNELRHRLMKYYQDSNRELKKILGDDFVLW